MRNVLAAILWMTCLGLGVAHAQLVPPVQLPPVPLPPEKVSGMSLPQTSVTRNLDALAGARILRVESLAREHRAELERDPHGELVVRAEVVAIDITAAALKRALADDFLASHEVETVLRDEREAHGIADRAAARAKQHEYERERRTRRVPKRHSARTALGAPRTGIGRPDTGRSGRPCVQVDRRP
jgi:hypothetical protein